ncbi:hypothetical protein TWF730_001797 [Orbilia blumenaviensis]|uniref:F-box domain-containing protein n=1 Tax=Orbilia blumenaviensis TaxID=1796055 RepID=A0AAV9UGH1_9PEZI
MGLFKKRTKLDFRRSLLRAILPDLKSPPLSTAAEEVPDNSCSQPKLLHIEVLVDEKKNNQNKNKYNNKDSNRDGKSSKAAVVSSKSGFKPASKPELQLVLLKPALPVQTKAVVSASTPIIPPTSSSTKSKAVAAEKIKSKSLEKEKEREREEEKDTIKTSEILLLPAEILRDIFSYLDSRELQSLYHTHSRFRAIVLEHRSYFCRELAGRNLRYFARYLKPAFFDLQRQAREHFLPPLLNYTSGSNNDEEDESPCSNIPSWYLKLHKLDKITKQLYSLMPPDENEWELEYLRIQGLPPSQYNPRVWPRPGNPSFYFTHTIISFYQYNSLLKLPKDSLVDFKERDVKPVCRCAQGYFRSTAHLGILCAVYMACLKYNNAQKQQTENTSNNSSNNNGNNNSGKVEEGGADLSEFLPELGGGLGNYIKGTRVSVKELFKMVVVVTYPGNLLKVIEDPSGPTMARLKVVLETLKEVLVGNEEERRQSGVDRMYTKGLEMMEGFARYWDAKKASSSTDELLALRYFDDWDLL